MMHSRNDQLSIYDEDQRYIITRFKSMTMYPHANIQCSDCGLQHVCKIFSVYMISNYPSFLVISLLFGIPKNTIIWKNAIGSSYYGVKKLFSTMDLQVLNLGPMFWLHPFSFTFVWFRIVFPRSFLLSRYEWKLDMHTQENWKHDKLYSRTRGLVCLNDLYQISINIGIEDYEKDCVGQVSCLAFQMMETFE